MTLALSISATECLSFRFIFLRVECEYSVIHVLYKVQLQVTTTSKEYDTDTVLVANERFVSLQKNEKGEGIIYVRMYGVLYWNWECVWQSRYLNKVASLFALAREKRVQFGDECILRVRRDETERKYAQYGTLFRRSRAQYPTAMYSIVL